MDILNLDLNSLGILLVSLLALFMLPFIFGKATASASQHPSPFSAKSTAKGIVDHYSGTDPEYLAGRTYIVTGGNSGIGLETCKALSSCGAKVILCSRSVEAGLRAVETEVKAPGEGNYVVQNPKILVKQLDLESLQSVKAFADDILSSELRIDGVVFNAGIMALSNLEYTAAGFEKQIGVNHMGHFYLYNLLEERLIAQKQEVRIATLSSKAHDMGPVIPSDLHFKRGRSYKPWVAYGQSKLANLLFAKSIADKFLDRPAEQRIVSSAIDPGVIATNLTRHQSAIGAFLFSFFVDKTVPQGAATTLYGLLGPADAINGAYLKDCCVGRPKNAAGIDESGAGRRALWEASQAGLDSALAGKAVE
jgi:retinol dehydrogenase 12